MDLKGILLSELSKGKYMISFMGRILKKKKKTEEKKPTHRFVSKGGSVGGRRNWMKMVKRYKIHIR